MTRLLIVVMLVLMPLPAHADSLFTAGQIAFAIAQAGDGVTTVHCVQEGRCQEANPVAQPFAGSVPGMIALKVGTTVGVLWIVRKMEKRHSKAAKIVIWSVAGIVGGVAIHNVRYW